MAAIAKPLNLEEVVRDKFRAVLVDAIPPEQMNKLVSDTWSRFTTRTRAHYSSDPRPSPLDQLLDKVMTEEVTKLVRAHIASQGGPALEALDLGTKIDEAIKVTQERAGEVLLRTLVTKLEDAMAMALHNNLESSIEVTIQNMRNQGRL